MEKLIITNLIEQAFLARKNAYAPYSNFHVGAALLTSNEKIYTGCNIENAAFTPGNCAERTAIFKAVSEGVRDFLAIAIVGGKKDTTQLNYCAPCGVCRQVMMEFVNPEKFLIILAKSKEEYQIYSLKDLFPLGFGPDDLA